MKSFAAAVVLVLSSLVLMPATPAHADTRGCVTKRELARVGDTNLSMRQVHRVFDTRGRQTSRDRDEIQREYRGCKRGSSVGVNYSWRNGAWRWWGHWSYGL